MLASRDSNSDGSLISHANIVREIFSRPVKLQEYVRGVRAGLKMAQTTSNSLNVSFVTKRNPLSLAHSTCCNAALKYSDGTSDGLLRKEKKKKEEKRRNRSAGRFGVMVSSRAQLQNRYHHRSTLLFLARCRLPTTEMYCRWAHMQPVVRYGITSLHSLLARRRCGTLSLR